MRQILQSKVMPGDGVTAPLRVVLSMTHPGCVSKFATHLENMQAGGKFDGRFDGHYFDSMAAAGKDYAARCKRLGVSERE